MRFASAAATLVVAALFSAPCHAQADSARTPAVRQRLTVRPVFRRYTVDTTTVTEQAAGVDYAVTAGRARVRLTGSSLRFSDGATTIRGAAPAELAADVRVGRRDTLRVTLRGPSLPRSLGTGQVSALGSVGTATLDLESVAMGTTAAGGLRLALARPAGAVLLGARLGVDAEPRPAARDSIYWRGTTVRLGGSLTGFAGEFRITGGFDLTRSFGDSLGGRNLFPGGGSLMLRADASGIVGTGATLATLSAFYFRPFATARPVQANRLTPTGDLAGVTAGLLIPAGLAFVMPTVSLTRESSSATQVPYTVGQGLSVTGLGWALNGALGADLPVGRRVSLSPEAGFVGGRVRSEVSLFPIANPGGRPGAASVAFSDPVSGWWTALEVSVLF